MPNKTALENVIAREDVKNKKNIKVKEGWESSCETQVEILNFQQKSNESYIEKI